MIFFELVNTIDFYTHGNISPGDITVGFTTGIPVSTLVTLRRKRVLRRASDDSTMVHHRQNAVVGNDTGLPLIDIMEQIEKNIVEDKGQRENVLFVFTSQPS